MIGAQRRAWLNQPTEGNDKHVIVNGNNMQVHSSIESDNEEDALSHEKSNVLLIGPTGSGIIIK